MQQIYSNKVSLFVVTVPLVAIFMFSLVAFSATLSTDEYDSIQEAIDEAAPGDTVQVKPGMYKENLEINKDLSLKGKNATIRSRKNNYPILHVGPSNVEIEAEGMKFIWAIGETCSDTKKGLCPVGISVTGEAELQLKDCLVFSNDMQGIRLSNSAEVHLDNSTISENGISGIELGDSSKATVTNSNIQEHMDAAAIQVGDSSQVTVSDSTISNNGHGVRLTDSAKATISNSKITESWFYGIILHGTSGVTLKNNLVEGCEVGLVVHNPDDYKGKILGSGNEMEDNDSNFRGIPSDLEEDLLS